MTFKIDGKDVIYPNSYKLDLIPVTDAERLADNYELKVKGVAHKHKVYWSYKTIKQSDLGALLSIWSEYVNNKNIIHTITTPSPTGDIVFKGYFATLSIGYLNPGNTEGDTMWGNFELTWVEV